MIKVILFLLTFIFGSTIYAQIPDGSVVPDFTSTDINGVEHNLYSYLEEGKTVILDVFATWCGPCWGYHQEHHLSKLYSKYGPEGVDNVVILLIEADGNTGLAELQGSGNSTGNWIVDTPYPIFDDAEVGTLLGVNAYPTIFKICPIDKTIYEIGQLDSKDLEEVILDPSCMPPTTNNDLAILEFDYPAAACHNIEMEIPMTIINMGTISSSSLSIELLLDDNVIATQEVTNSLETYEKVDLSFNATVVEPGTLSTNLVYMDDVSENNVVIKDFVIATETQTDQIKITIQCDENSTETIWRLSDGDGKTVVAGGFYPSNFLAQETVDVPVDECFEFLITDSQANGLDDTGFYRITNAADEVIIEGGSFSSQDLRQFSVISTAPTSTHFNDLINDINIYPNPVQEVLNIEFTLLSNLQLSPRIYSVTGDLVQTNPEKMLVSGQNMIQINTQNLPNGMYYAHLKGENTNTIRKFIISK